MQPCDLAFLKKGSMSNTQNSNSVQMITKLIVRCFVSAGEQLEALTVSEGKRQTRGRTQSCRLALCVCVCVCLHVRVHEAGPQD